MHCLLCHEKIPRFRYWRTKSEFCCDEHAAAHRRQTLERLVGGVFASAEGAEGSVDPEERLAALAESGQAQPAGRLFDTASEAGSEVTAFVQAPSADAEQEADTEQAAEEEFAAASSRHTGDDESESAEDQREAAEQGTEWTALETELAARDDESHELEAVTHEGELAAEKAEEDEAAGGEHVSEEERGAEDLIAEEAAEDEDEDEPAYFDTSSVQHDEPFPLDIAPAPVSISEGSELEPEISEPLEPAALEESSTGDLLDLLAKESASGSETDLELRQADNSAAAEATVEPGEPTSDTEATDNKTELPATEMATEGATETADDETPQEVSGSLDSSAATEPELIPQQPEVHAAEATADQPSPTSQSADTADEAAIVEARKPAKGSGLQPLQAWDPARPRGGRKGKGRLSSGESLNRLAGQLVDRDSKLRELGPGSEARREHKSKLVCFLPVQGGNGSSTVSLHVAEAISHHLNKRVLLADFDFHSGTLAFRLGLKPEHTFVDVFKWEEPENEAWDKVVCPWKKLDVLVAPPSNASIRPQSMDRLPDIFMSALRRYPYVIIDHPDAIYSSSRHILAMSDLVYLVCTPEITSLHLARRKVQQIRSMGVPGERLRLIVNRTGSWGSLGLEDVGKIAGVPVSWALMNDYAALRDAVWNGGLVQEGSGLAKQLRELGWSIMGVDAQVAEESAIPSDVASHA